jgi:CheY-like chemotaxis protein
VTDIDLDTLKKRSGRVLLVEDNQDIRKIIGYYLELAGLQVEYAANGQIGVELGKQPTIDLILMDLAMPKLDGYQATKLLREGGVTTPIIALTAHTLSTDQELSLSAGCNAFLTKPIGLQELIAAIDRFLPARQV